MGSFMGNAISGSFFIAFGLWHAFQAFRQYFTTRQRNTRFTSTITFPCDCLCGRLKELPLEGALKILIVVTSVSGEMILAFDKERFVFLGSGRHATMFFFFGISGIVDVLVHYRAPLPPDIDYVTAILAFGMELLMVKFSLYGMSEIAVTVNTLLMYVIIASAVAVAMEMKYRHSLLGPLSRGYFLLLQGTWLWHVGFILHNPFSNSSTVTEISHSWTEDEHNQLIMASLFFVWHCAVNFILILMIGASIACCYRRRSDYSQDESVGMKRLIHMGANGQTLVALNDDSDLDSDIEFQKPANNRR